MKRINFKNFVAATLQRNTELMDNFRHRLAFADALPQLTIAGLMCGISAALLIVLFRLLIDAPLSWLLPENSERFEALDQSWRFGLPFIGATALGITLHFINKKYHAVSVAHVLERLHRHQGLLPIPNFLVQFFGGIICLLSGQSMGREGPAVHIGAAAASQLGQWLKLPHNSLRTLIACGAASAIAASFNTPMAGVIFAMEVVLMEYTIIGFIPVILASVSGAILTQVVFGSENIFSLSDTHINTLWELPYMIFAGLIIAACAAAYIRLIVLFNRFQSFPMYLRLPCAGFATGVLALFVPEILGMGYDTVSSALLGELGLSLLASIIIAKILATTISVGVGMPAGLIGPCLVIGACIGGIVGIFGNAIFPEQAASSSFYVILGMSAMMGAVLNAPLAALIAILELSYNPNIIFPGMLIIVVACFATRQFFHCNSIFQEQLKTAGKLSSHEPAQQILSRIGVRSVMNTAYIQTPITITATQAQELLRQEPQWLMINDTTTTPFILRAANLANYLENLLEEQPSSEQNIDLSEIPGERLRLLPIHERANLYEAKQLLQQSNGDALYVGHQNASNTAFVLGIITHEAILNRYKI